MQKLIKAFENMMVAVTFAEVGEYDEARKISSKELDVEGAVETQSTAKAAGKA